MIRSIRDEVLLMLEGRGAILDVAREVSRLMENAAVGGPSSAGST